MNRPYCLTYASDHAILGRRPHHLLSASSPNDLKNSQKAPKGSKRRKASKSDHSRVQNSAASHPLLEVDDGQTVHVTGQCRDDKYHLTRHQHLASTGSASLYTADYSLRPGQVVVTKALMVGHGARTTAKRWEREVTTHKRVDGHVSNL